MLGFGKKKAVAPAHQAAGKVVAHCTTDAKEEEASDDEDLEGGDTCGGDDLLAPVTTSAEKGGGAGAPPRFVGFMAPAALPAAAAAAAPAPARGHVPAPENFRKSTSDVPVGPVPTTDAGILAALVRLQSAAGASPLLRVPPRGIA